MATPQIDELGGIHVKGGQTDVTVSDATASRILDSIDAFGADLRDHPAHSEFAGFLVLVIVILGFYYLFTRQRLKFELEKFKIENGYKNKFGTRVIKNQGTAAESDE